MAQYVVYRTVASGTQPVNYITNIVEWDGTTPYDPGAGLKTALRGDVAYSVGDTYGTPPAAPVTVTPTLAERAATVYSSAVAAIYANYTVSGEAIPADVTAYMAALKAIANGTDTTSTALPAQPTDVMTASTAAATT